MKITMCVDCHERYGEIIHDEVSQWIDGKCEACGEFGWIPVDHDQQAHLAKYRSYAVDLFSPKFCSMVER